MRIISISASTPTVVFTAVTPSCMPSENEIALLIEAVLWSAYATSTCMSAHAAWHRHRCGQPAGDHDERCGRDARLDAECGQHEQNDRPRQHHAASWNGSTLPTYSRGE